MEIIQPARPLSESILWALQAAYYHEKGPVAWDKIPFHCTSNACIARSYADMIVTFALEADGPLTVVELGAGHGVFSRHLLRELAARQEYLPEDWTYLMTDLCPANVAAWTDLPANVRAEVLDVAGAAPVLTGRTVVIANYVFDSIPCELYTVQAGQISVRDVALVKTGDGPAVPANLDMRPAGSRPVTVPDPVGAVLKTYEGNVIFSTAAANLLMRLAGQKKPLLVLAADKGYCAPGPMLAADLHRYVAHDGAFSFMVNFHGLGLLTERLGGTAYLSDSRGALAVAAFGFATGWQLDYQLKHQFTQYDTFNHVFELSGLLSGKPGLSALLAYLDLFNCDPDALAAIAPHLMDHRQGAPDAHPDLFRLIARSIDHTPADRPEARFLAGKLLGAFGYPLQALPLLLDYLKDHPDEIDALYYAALTFRTAGHFTEAWRLARRAVERDPACQYARNLCDELVSRGQVVAFMGDK